MIDVDRALEAVPAWSKFAAVSELDAQLDRLRTDQRFTIVDAGHSASGHPIRHVRFGAGRTRALFVGFPHPMEPIGGLTVASLLHLLESGNEALVAADVEWNIVPCIDPDGAKLNEAWTQEFTFKRFLENYYLQSAKDQADMSFPISYKKLVVNAPSPEAVVLRSVLDAVQPDFYMTLHNTRFGGAFYLASHDFGQPYHGQLHGLLERLGFPLQTRAPWKEVGERYAPGIGEVAFTKKVYDYLEMVSPAPEDHALIRYGGESWDYMKEKWPQSLTFVAEMGCIQHPDDDSDEVTEIDLRWLMLRIDAESKALASELVDEWERLRDSLDSANPFYRSIVGGTVLPKRNDILHGGWPMARYPSAEYLTNPDYARKATRSDLLNVCVVDGGYYFTQWAYQFMRLLRSSPGRPGIEAAIERIDAAFARHRAEIERHIDTSLFRVADHRMLAQVQLGSGFIALNSVIARDRM